jgi:hypothetical protein
MTSTRDLRTLFRAREIVQQMSAVELEAAIEQARDTLVAAKGRNRYLQEILPDHVAYAVPGAGEAFVLECVDEQRFRLRDGTMSLLWQIRSIEQGNDTLAVKVIHYDGRGKREYWL